MYVYAPHAYLVPKEVDRDVGPLGSDELEMTQFITHSWEPPCGCWELNLGLLEE